MHLIRSIIPPYMLEQLAKHGDSKQKRLALETLIFSERIRGRREAMALYYVAPPAAKKCIRIYDSQNGGFSGLPGELVKNPQNSNDVAVKEAWEGLEATYTMYRDLFERNSIDDRGMCMEASVHFDLEYCNAFWDGRQMVFGDGDGQFFNRFTKCLDVIAHELSHGVVEYEAGLQYSGQSGALNESFCDVMGSMLKQWKLGQTVEQADWLIGAGLFTDRVNGVALRSMKEPGTAYNDPILGKDPQPAHMKDYVEMSEKDDSGGVHVNSGIPSRAFYLAARAIGGNAWEKAGRIWYVAIRDFLRPTADFKKAAELIARTAGYLFGAGTIEQKAVTDAWKEVGV